jgi:hypothetical protein
MGRRGPFHILLPFQLCKEEIFALTQDGYLRGALPFRRRRGAFLVYVV